MSQAGQFNTEGPNGDVEKLTPDSGGAVVPTAGNINIFGTHGINTVNAGVSTMNVAINNAITLGDLTDLTAGMNALTIQTGDIQIQANKGVAGNLKIPATSGANVGVIQQGGSRFIHSSGTNNTFVGKDAGNFTYTGTGSVAIGTNAMKFAVTGSNNIAIGLNALEDIKQGIQNVAIGTNSMLNYQGSAGGSNIALGTATLENLNNGVRNLAFGSASGFAYTGNESNNILLGGGPTGTGNGLAGDNNTLRIGYATGTGEHELDKAFIHGINGANLTTSSVVGIDSTTSQLSTTLLVGGTNMTITAGTGSVTFDSSTTPIVAYTAITDADSPYSVLATDNVVGVDNNSTTVSVVLPVTPTVSQGRVFTIKDRAGTASATNPINITVSGGVNIDGSATKALNNPYESIKVIFNGTKYFVI